MIKVADSKMKAYMIFSKELEELLIFLKAGIFSFDSLREIENFEQKIFDSEYSQLIDSQIQTNYTRIEKIQGNGLHAHLRFNLRELIFIRLISALEVYLVDNVRDVFAENKTPFKDNSQVVEINKAEILSYKSIIEVQRKILNRECRQLSSGGYIQIVKYYKRRFNILLNEISPGQKKIEEYHDIRHLFVHRLGRTDEIFRKKYNTSKLGLSIDDDFLINAILEFKLYVDEVHKLTENVILNYCLAEKKKKKKGKRKIFRFRKKDTGTVVKFLEPEFGFWVNEHFVTLAELNPQIEILENDFILVEISDNKGYARIYLKIARRICKESESLSCFQALELEETMLPEIKEKKKKTKKIIDQTIIQLVKENLPLEPWEIGIHKILAKKLGIKNGTVFRAIKYLRGVERID